MGSINNPGASGGVTGLADETIGTLSIPITEVVAPNIAAPFVGSNFGSVFGGVTYRYNASNTGSLSMAALGGTPTAADPTSNALLSRIARRVQSSGAGIGFSTTLFDAMFQPFFARTTGAPFVPWALFHRFGLENGTKLDGRLFTGMSRVGASNIAAGLLAMQDIIGIGKDDADANFQFIHNDNAGNATVTDTGIVVQTGVIYDLYIYATDGNLAMKFFDIQNPAAFASIDAALNIPTLDVSLRYTHAFGNGNLTAPAFETVPLDAWYYGSI